MESRLNGISPIAITVSIGRAGGIEEGKEMKRIAIGLAWMISLIILAPSFMISSSQSAQAITFGCKTAQRQAEMLASRAEIGMKLENKYRLMPIYADAYRQYVRANEDYRDWERTISKSPKCFKQGEVRKIRKALKPISVYESMSTRYGATIAQRNNYGSPDPCFKYLGEDNAYLACSIDNY